ncbi:hypothetical protein OG609_10850 [Streptomyces sp. NBC_01224]|uniref:hypothetical protein n=1 Tax=Streptomyces sp. NBC_01224 TaxID=2903783 RepID=UPI002E0EE86A|nr:hypothetical protein OG609_10850 [Streptomyces sp. NBC_01224]
MKLVVPLLLGAGLFLFGLALAANYRGLAHRVVNIYLNPAFFDPYHLRRLKRRGVDHPGMVFLANTEHQQRRVRILGGAQTALGLLIISAVAVSVIHA